MSVFQRNNVTLFTALKQHSDRLMQRTVAKLRKRGLTRRFMHRGTVLGLLTVRAETVRNGEHRNKGLHVRYTILRELAQFL